MPMVRESIFALSQYILNFFPTLDKYLDDHGITVDYFAS